MSNVVELLEKLSKPKSVNVSNTFKAPKGSLDKQELYSAICVAGKKSPIGLAIVMATEFGEIQYVEQLQRYLIDKLGSEELMAVAYSELCFLPLGKNQLRIKSLLKQYGPRAKRSRRLIDSWTRAIKSMTRSGRHHDLITQHLSNIESERHSLDEWATKYSKLSCNCPRCGATGSVNSEQCKSCHGDGHFKNKTANWKEHLGQFGISLTPELTLRIESLLDDLSIKKNTAIDAMSKRARLERAD
ncbi:TIGR02642 family protein [Vibrio diazotrophicus]|uniref:TIGR02642 family protein n=1 Tax=Vibrio diazotrophicus TaxID=685 RepID=UPI003D2F677C